MTSFTSSRARDHQGTAAGHRARGRACRSARGGAQLDTAAASRSGGHADDCFVGADRFPAPTGGGRYRSTLVLAIGPFRDWLAEHMTRHELASTDVAAAIGTDEAVVRGWFGVRPRDWRQHPTGRFVVHVISESTVETVGIALTGNPRLAAELYPHLAEPVCQHCGAHAGCRHLGRDLALDEPGSLAA
jgi:hypothetical protein